MSYSSFCGFFLHATWRSKTQDLASGCMAAEHPWSLLATSSHEVRRNPPATWPKGSGYPLLLLHGAIPAAQPQGDEAGLIIVINVFLVSTYSVPEGILWVWYMRHCGMQQNFLALQLWRYIFIFSRPIKHAAQGHDEYVLQKLKWKLQGSSLKVFLNNKTFILLVKQR